MSNKVTGLHRFYKRDTSSKYTLVKCGTILYSLAAASGHAGTEEKTGLTANAETYFCDFGDNCFIADGKSALLKFDGSDVYKAGIAAPGTAPSQNTVGSGGSLSAGDYKFKLTYVDADGNESNGSSASSAITATANQKITINIAIYEGSDYSVAKRRIYRTVANGEDIYYYDGEVADNETTTYESTMSDTSLIAQSTPQNDAYLHTNHTTPPSAPDYVTKKRNRLFLGVDDSLYFSKLTYEYFPSAYFIKTGDRQKIRGLVEQLYFLHSYTDDNVEALKGTSANIDSSDYFEFTNMYAPHGCIATRSLANCNNLILFLTIDGIYYQNVDQIKPINEILNGYIKDNINPTYRHLSAGVFYKNTYYLSYPKGVNTVPSETVFYDFTTGTFGVYSFAFNCYCVWDKGGDPWTLQGGSTTVGRVYDVLSGLTDDGSNIEAYDDIMGLNFGFPDRYKQVYDIYIKVKSTTGTGLRLYYTLDNNAETYEDITLTADTTQWYRVRLDGGGQRCREIAIRPRMSDAYAWEIHGYQFVYSVEELLV